MRRVHFLLSITFVVLFFVSTVIAQDKKKKIVPPPPAATVHEAYVPYWNLEPGWHTEIELRNNILKTPLVVTPILRTGSGAEIPLDPVTIAPSDVTVVDLHQAVMSKAPQLVDAVGSYGSVLLQYGSSFPHNLFAAAMVHYEGKPIAFHFDADGPEDLINEGARESIWWLPNPTTEGHLIISNSSSKPAQLTVTIFGGNGKPFTQPLVLGPKQTHRYSIRELVTANGISGTSGGLRVTVNHGSESVLAALVSFDTSTGFAALMRTFEDSPKEKPHTVVLRAAMLALSHPDPILGLPEDTVLQPQLFLRNTQPTPLLVKAELRWHSAANQGFVSLADMQLAANETRTVDLYQMQQSGAIPADASWGYVELTYNGRYGDLAPIVASYTADLTRGLQTPFTDIVASHWVGSQWFADPLRRSLITAGNATDKPTTVAFTLHYNSGQSKYEMEQKLAPGEQMYVDVAKIIQTQMPDKNGHTIPPETTSGSYSFRDTENVLGATLFEGKLTIDRKYGFAVYGCGNCCDPVPGPTFDPNPFSGFVGGNWNDTVWGFDQCDNSEWDLTYDAYGWYSDNTGVMTQNNYTSTGVGPGSADTFASIYAPTPFRKCPYQVKQMQNSGTVVCATPTNFALTESNQPDGTLYFRQTFSSSTGNLNDLASCTVGESVFYPNYPTSPYTWPLPMVQSTANPTVLSGAATGGYFEDRNKPPSSYQTPYQNASFSATQRIWWQCSCYQNGNLNYFVPDVTISRQIFLDTDGKWKYKISKTVNNQLYTNTVVLP